MPTTPIRLLACAPSAKLPRVRVSPPSGSRRMSAPAEASDPAAEGELLRRIAAGDRVAFGLFYDRFSRPLYATALRIVNDAAEAQDILHDAFVVVWEKAGSFDASKGSAFSWIVSLVRHRAIDRVRSRHRRAELLTASVPSDLGYASDGDTRGVEEAVAAGEDSQAVRNALAQLSPDQQKAVELAFFSGLTQEEIARSLNEPLGTVKARIRRGLLKLRDVLASRT